MTANLADRITHMPKAELHMHLEGSLEPEMLFALARRNGVDIGYPSEDALRRAYVFDDLQSFLDLYYAGLRVLLTERDFFDMTAAYLDRAHAEHVIHAEVFISPQPHLRRGIPLAAVMDGILAALDAAERRHGMSTGLILVFQRQFPEEDAFDVFRAAMPYASRILGFGLGGPELGNPPGKFARVFAAARAAGFRCVAHAGEEGPPDYVRETLDQLRVDRVDHGVRAGEDPELVARLAAEGVPLTVCPISNVQLRVFPTLAEHNLAQLLRAGVFVTVNSDDPPYFGGYVTENFLRSQQALGLTEAEIHRLGRNGFLASFAPEPRKAELLRRYDRFWQDSAADLRP